MSTFVPGQLPGVEQVLFRLRSFNANAATGAGGSQKMERIIPAGARFSILRVDAANGSISLTTATLSLGNVAGGAQFMSAVSMAGVTGPTTGTALTPLLGAARGYNETTQDVWASLGTAQGASATCDLYVVGRVI